MRSSTFIAVVLISGVAAGTVQGAVNLVMVEPYLDEAVSAENREMLASGEADDTPEFWAAQAEYRLWQKGGQVMASAILGTSMGALFGIVYALSRSSLPGRSDLRKALVLAGVMWLVVFMVPALKYPANPPTVGEGDTVGLRAILQVALTAISGAAALLFYIVSRRLRGYRKLFSAAGYCLVVGIALAAMPSGPDGAEAPVDLEAFRAASVLAVSSYWVTLPLIVAVLWNRLRPDRILATEP